MGDSKLYSAEDIEKLKQKIASYKDTLTTLKTGNSVEDYLAMKSEANGFKTKVSKLEGVMELMNEKQSVQMEGYEQQIKSFSLQMDSLNKTIEELNQDLSLVKNKIITEDSNDLTVISVAPVDVQNSLTVANNNEERTEEFIEETTFITSVKKSNQPPSFKELQDLVAKATNIQENPSDATPIGSFDSHKEFPKDQHFSRRNFPYTSDFPSQVHNGLYRNVNKPPSIHLTNAVKIQEIPININENLDPTLILTTNEPKINETVTPDPILLETTSQPEINETVTPDPALLETTSQPEINETVTPNPILLETTSQPEINETVTPDPPLLETTSEPEITVTTYPEEMHNVATIEEDKAPIEISNVMKRQQHKNKETLSLLNFFRKKH